MKVALNGIMREIRSPLQEVERELRAAFGDAPNEARDVALHLVEAGGKRVRPLMTLLSARLFSDDVTVAVPVAVAAEMIHMATLVHDDVIDQADTRRGRSTVNARWNSHIAVLTGDALLARALVILVERSEPRIVRIMSEMIYRMCEGEIAQHHSMYDLNQTEDAYLDRIEKKTALFFAACCQSGGLMAGANERQAAALWGYGRHIGMAFQIVDDLLDVTAAAEVLGKPVGSDLAAGVITLPILHLIRDPDVPSWVRRRLEEPPLSDDDLREILELVRGNGSLEYTRSVAQSYVEKAKAYLRELPGGEVNELLAGIADEVLERDF